MIRACPSCDAKNRVPAAHLTDMGKCGKCKDPLPPVAHPIDADPETFQEVVSGAKAPVLVDFWASWCGPCRMVAPEVVKTAQEMAGEAIVIKVDTERHPELAQRFNVQGIPNFVVLRNGKVVLQQAGAVRTDQMQEWLRAAADE
jgi:thioredoxin 2